MIQGHYTLVKLSPNPNAGDSISIGLIFESETIRFARFSRQKIDIVSRLNGFGSKLIEDMANQIESYYASDIDRNIEKLFREDNLGVNYFRSLHISSQNLLQFSDPKPLNIKSIDDCLKMYKNFVDNQDTKNTKQGRHGSEVRRKMVQELFPRIRDLVTLDQTITSTHLPKLEKTFRFDALGKNGKLLSITGFDTDTKPETLYGRFQRYEIVWNYLLEVSGMDGMEFVILDEPNHEKENFLLYEKILKEKGSRVVGSNSFDKLIETVISSGVNKVNLDEILSNRT